MRILIQRVKQAQVDVNGKTVGKIAKGLLVFIGITSTDTDVELKYLADKVLNLRIFDDEGKRNQLSVQDIKGELLVVSQFTLYGDCRKGRRPGFDKAAPPEMANMLYLKFVEQLRQSGLKVETGEFQAMMQVELINDGPVTYFLEK